jgi:hydroxysqualene synthase
MSTNSAAVETPSGKDAATENFPVGSFLIAAPLRPHVAAYYAFARAIDDIADNGALQPEDKIRRLDLMAAALEHGADAGNPALAKAHALRSTMLACSIPFAHGLDLISAFRQDAVKTRYASWDELMDYCDRSASPVGRFLLDLHGEDRTLYVRSDALCNALQVINHLQDLRDDYRTLERVYLPEDWMADEGARREDLAGNALTPALRRVAERCLIATRALNAEAAGLASGLKSRRLGMESGIIHNIAVRLTDELSRRDPLAERVKLNRWQLIACGLGGVIARLGG